MTVPIKKTPMSEIHLETMEKLSEGFKKPDFSYNVHREIAGSITRTIVNSEEPVVRAKGVEILGSYANGDFEWGRPSIQKDIIDTIISIGEKDKAMNVKNTTLTQLSLILKNQDSNKKHAQVVKGIGKIVGSVTVLAENSPEAAYLVRDGLYILISYVNNSGDYRYGRPEIQSKAIETIDYIIVIADVAKFENLNSKP